MNWILKKFDELTLAELYTILRLRCEIFIVEQVAYQDVDNTDQQAWHLFALDEQGEAAAYLRIFPKGVVYDHAAAIGRVCVRMDHRRKGIAAEMMDTALRFMDEELKEPLIHISAQQYLTAFYESRGFVCHGEGYLEDGIPHIGMERTLSVTSMQ